MQNLTVLVCTRNRGDSIVDTVETILANTHPCFELLVVDQSTDETTAQAIAPFQEDPRLRYTHSDTKGLGCARNLGLRIARSQIVVFTDDDCTVPNDWLIQMEQVFVDNPNVAVAFCNVAPGPHDPALGFIPAYCRKGAKLVTHVAAKCRARGMGAGIAVRRDVVLSFGGFDEMMGAGGQFSSGEDWDMAVRALLKGHQVYETSSTMVLHHGFRTWDEGRLLTERDWRGIGAVFGKPLRCGYWRIAVVAVYELSVHALWPLLRDLVTLHKPRGFRKIRGFWSGFREAWRFPIDRDTLCFRQDFQQNRSKK